MEASTPPSAPAAKSKKPVFLVLGSLLAVIVLGAVVYFATHTSKEDKALQAVCASRADIKDRVNALASTTVANFTLDGFKQNVGAISSDLSTIRANQSKLEPSRKQQVQAANQQFANSVTTTLKSLGTSLSISNAQEKLKAAGQELVSSYQQTLQPVDCSGVDITG